MEIVEKVPHSRNQPGEPVVVRAVPDELYREPEWHREMVARVLPHKAGV